MDCGRTLLLELQEGNEVEKGRDAGHEGGVLFKFFGFRIADGWAVWNEKAIHVRPRLMCLICKHCNDLKM